jgi:hypothetical protein
MCGGLAKFNNRYFQGKGNVEAPMTRLELMVAGMLGIRRDASNEVESNSFVKQTSSIHQTYQKPWCIL